MMHTMSPALTRLCGRGQFTDAEVAHLLEWLRDPQAWVLPAPLLEILLEVAQPGAELERIERRRKLPARSLKAIVKLTLQCLVKPEPHRARAITAPRGDADEATADEQLAFLAAAAPEAWLPLVQRFGLSPMQARLLHILKVAPFPGQPVPYEYLMRALYLDRIDEAPDRKILDVYVFRIRKAIRPAGWAIETMWGYGYTLKLPPDEAAPGGRLPCPAR